MELENAAESKISTSAPIESKPELPPKPMEIKQQPQPFPPHPGQQSIKKEAGTETPAQAGAGAAGTNLIGKHEELIKEKDKKRLANEILSIIEKTSQKKKVSKEEERLRRLQAAGAAIIGGKLNFEMKVNEKDQKISLECTNSKLEVGRMSEAIKSS